MLPLLIAKAIYEMLKYEVMDQLQDVYGILGQQSHLHLLCHQFVVNMLSSAKGLDMPLRSVDKLVSDYLKPTPNFKW